MYPVIFIFFLPFCFGVAVNKGVFRPDYQYIADANGWFKLHRNPANWNDARIQCELEDATLASPLNEPLRKQILSMITSQSQQSNESSKIFTGIHDTFSKRDFHSVEGVPLADIPHSWAPQEPDNQGDDESCIAMYENGSLADVKCSREMQYVCYRQHTSIMVLNQCGTIDNGVPLADIPHSWAPQEPDNQGDDESCIAMYENGSLADVKCSREMQYVCYRQHTSIMVLNQCGTIDNEYHLAQETKKCYKFHTKPVTWVTAQFICSGEGGHLAIINSQKEADVLKKIFSEHPESQLNLVSAINKPINQKNFAFVGFHDKFENGNWVTIFDETLEEAGYSKWQTNEPNNYNSAMNNWEGEHCGTITRNGELNDYWCEDNLVFIC